MSRVLLKNTNAIVYVYGNRLKAELEKKDVEYEESLAILNSRHSIDIKDFQAQLQESETTRQLLQAEVCGFV